MAICPSKPSSSKQTLQSFPRRSSPHTHMRKQTQTRISVPRWGDPPPSPSPAPVVVPEPSFGVRLRRDVVGVRGLLRPLLARPAIQGLRLATRLRPLRARAHRRKARMPLGHRSHAARAQLGRRFRARLHAAGRSSGAAGAWLSRQHEARSYAVGRPLACRSGAARAPPARPLACRSRSHATRAQLRRPLRARSHVPRRSSGAAAASLSPARSSLECRSGETRAPLAPPLGRPLACRRAKLACHSGAARMPLGRNSGAACAPARMQ